VKGALLISHGSRSQAAREEVFALARRLKDASGLPVFECAFLDVESPNIPEGAAACARAGCRDVTVLLNFLNSGNHVLKDVPALIDAARAAHPGVAFHLTPPIGQHPGVAELFLKLLTAPAGARTA